MGRKGATVRDVAANKWIKAMAQQFKREGKLMVPNCTDFLKTSHGRERAPQNNDWYYYRCAAVLRKIYLRPGNGYGGLSKAFGNKKNKGSLPESTVRASIGPLHWACKSLEGLKLIGKGKAKGRVLTREGRKRCDTVAFNASTAASLVTRRPRRTNKKEKKNLSPKSFFIFFICFS